MTREQKLEKVLRYIGWMADGRTSVNLTDYIGELAVMCASDDDELDSLVRVIDKPPVPPDLIPYLSGETGAYS